MKHFCFYILLLAGSFFVPVQLGTPCPEIKNIEPCVCTNLNSAENRLTILTCVHRDADKLTAAFKTITSKDFHVDTFNISSSHLTKLYRNFFIDMNVRKAVIYGDRWSSIDEYAFLGQESHLTWLEFQESILTSIPIRALRRLRVLDKFIMYNSEVNFIEENAFDSMDSATVLLHINLSKNYIRSVGKGAFSKLTNLQTLNLNDNKLRSLSCNVLPNGNRIKTFSIRGNLLASVVGDIATFPIGAHVDMMNNKIETVSKEIIKTMIENRLVVNLNGNPLSCTCSMKQLAETTDETISGRCQLPRKLYGRELGTLTSADFSGCNVLHYLLNLLETDLEISE